jgi:hypothetical protein
MAPALDPEAEYIVCDRILGFAQLLPIDVHHPIVLKNIYMI